MLLGVPRRARLALCREVPCGIGVGASAEGFIAPLRSCFVKRRPGDFPGGLREGRGGSVGGDLPQPLCVRALPARDAVESSVGFGRSDRSLLSALGNG